MSCTTWVEQKSSSQTQGVIYTTGRAVAVTVPDFFNQECYQMQNFYPITSNLAYILFVHELY